jgi:uncharacterized membrane protein
MHSVTDDQINFILDDIAKKGIKTEDVMYNILDHVCCIIENEMPAGANFHEFYRNTIARFYKKELKEIEDETQELITFKYYYAMKRTLKVSGLISVFLIIIGLILKVQHLPGAGISLVAGFTFFSLVFIPLLIITKFRDEKAKKNRFVVTLGMILTLTATLGMLFKVMHWPMAHLLFTGSLAVFGLVFIPIYFFSRFKDPELKFNTAINTVFMIAAAGMLFALSNNSNSQKFDESVEAMEMYQEHNAANMEQSNIRLYEDIDASVPEVKNIQNITAELEAILDGIKCNLIAKSEGISIDDAKTISISEVSHPNDFKVVANHFNGSDTEYSYNTLKSAVANYNAQISEMADEQIVRRIELDKLKMENTTLSVILNELVDIKIQALSNENSFLCLQKGLLASK